MNFNWQQIIQQYRRYLIMGGIFIFAMGGIGLGILQHQKQQLPNESDFTKIGSTQSQGAKKEKQPILVDSKDNANQQKSMANKMYIDVKGAVKQPGVYSIGSQGRVETIIALAGGALQDADLSQVNLAQRLKDQQIVYIPKRGEKIPAQFAQISVGNQNANNATTSSTSQINGNGTDNKQVNLNTATKEDLQTLTGVGPSKAAAILQYREEHGQFKTVEDLKQVSGIGEKTFLKLKPHLSV